MSSIKFAFKTCFDLLGSQRRNPRAYIGLLGGIIIALIPTINYLKFSMAIEEPISVFEPFVMMGSLRHYMTMTFLCLLFILSDAPFIIERTPYIIVRARKSNWAWGCILYIFATTIIYYIIIFLVTFFVSLRYGLIVNAWSQPMYIVSQLQPYTVYDLFSVDFRYLQLIREFLPARAAINTIILLISYGTCMITMMYVINLGLNKYMGTIFIIGIHLFGYVLLSDGYQKIIDYMPLTNALLGRHNLGNVSFSDSMFFSLRIFVILFILIILLMSIILNNTDVKMYTGKRQ